MRTSILILTICLSFKLYSQTLPSILFRFFISLVTEQKKYQQLKAYFFGVYDGFSSKGGKRHEQRGIF